MIRPLSDIDLPEWRGRGWRKQGQPRQLYQSYRMLPPQQLPELSPELQRFQQFLLSRSLYCFAGQWFLPHRYFHRFAWQLFLLHQSSRCSAERMSRRVKDCRMQSV